MNSGNCSNLSHLTYYATLAPSSTLFLDPLHHRCRSSPSLSFLSIIVIVPLHHRRRSSPSSPDTHHPGSNRLGRGSNSKTSRNSEILRTNIELEQGARCRRLESQKSDASSKYCGGRGHLTPSLTPNQPPTLSQTLSSPHTCRYKACYSHFQFEQDRWTIGPMYGKSLKRELCFRN